MKQAKLSFLRTSKRKAETIDPGPKSKRVKEATPAVSKKTEPETRETSKKKNVVQQLELMNNNKNETRFSDSMKDAVKTLCKICKYVVIIIIMRLYLRMCPLLFQRGRDPDQHERPHQVQTRDPDC